MPTDLPDIILQTALTKKSCLRLIPTIILKCCEYHKGPKYSFYFLNVFNKIYFLIAIFILSACEFSTFSLKMEFLKLKSSTFLGCGQTVSHKGGQKQVTWHYINKDYVNVLKFMKITPNLTRSRQRTQKVQNDKKTIFPKDSVKNADLQKTVFNKIKTTQR